MSDLRTSLTVVPLPAPPGVTRLELRGVIDDGAPLGALSHVSTPALELDLSGIRRITSFGVRDWIDALRRVPPSVRVVWQRVSVPMVSQLGMIANFAQTAQIDSFFAPYYCARCDADVRELLTPDEVAARPGHAPARPCPTCGGALTFDELESDYFAFLGPGDAGP